MYKVLRLNKKEGVLKVEASFLESLKPRLRIRLRCETKFFNKFKYSRKILEEEIQEYINYYNNERIKSNLNKMSPIKYRTHYYQN
nr:IS3 family transposase [Flavobacterium davisii]